MLEDTDDLQKIKICLNFFLDYKNFNFKKLLKSSNNGEGKSEEIKFDLIKEI